MDKVQKIIVLLLIVAIVFSAVSVVLNLSVFNLKQFTGNSAHSNSNGGAGVQLVVEPSGNGGNSG